MIISNSNNLAGSFKGQKKSQPIKLVLDTLTLDILCKYVLTQNRTVRMTHLVNLREMMFGLDPVTYDSDIEKQKRVQFILRALEARIDKRLNDRTAILVDANGGLPYDVNFLDFNNLELSKDELEWANQLISETIQYGFLYQKMDRLQDLITRFNTTTYQNRGMIAHEIEMMIDELKADYRKSRVENNALDMTFSLKSGTFENAVHDTYDIVTNPSRRLITGMYAFNEMTGGGLENGRVYCLFGNGGAGKSITLLNLAYQIKRYNAHYRTKDPSKTPCIVILTMENTMVETITRLFDMVTNSQGMSMADFSVDEVIDKMRTEGQLVINDASPIDIIVKYRPHRSVNTSFLYTLCDDLEDEGYEVIMLIQDHLKRIRSIYNNPDLRIELGDVINEFKVFAAEKDIPVLTNSHLNRTAAQMSEENANRSHRVDIVARFGKASVGESMLIIDNLDCGINIGKEYDEEGNCYMGFGLAKMRDKTNRMYFAQPFIPGSQIRLVEDMNGIPMFKESVHANPHIQQRSAAIRMNSSSALVDMNAIAGDDDNAFTAAKSYALPVEPPTPQMPAQPVIEVVQPQVTEQPRPAITLVKKPEPHCPIYFFNQPPEEMINDLKADLASLAV